MQKYATSELKMKYTAQETGIDVHTNAHTKIDE